MFTLYLDESGKNCLKSVDLKRPHFSFAALIIENTKKSELKIKADQIKFKYWDKTNIVFHATEIRHLSGPFSIFRGKNSKTASFQHNLVKFLEQMPFHIGLVCLNKCNYIDSNPPVKNAIAKLKISKNWAKMISGVEKNLTEKHASLILEMFLSFLVNRKCTGQVVIEATGDPQDLGVFKVYNSLLSYGCPTFGMKGADIRKIFTSISFVTKKNHDIETQIADLAAYYLSMEARSIQKIESISTGSFEEEIISVLKNKTFNYKCDKNGIMQNSFILDP